MKSERLARAEHGDAALVAVHGARDLDGAANHDEHGVRVAARRVQHRAARELEHARRGRHLVDLLGRKAVEEREARQERREVERCAARARDAGQGLRSSRSAARAGRSSAEASAASRCVHRAQPLREHQRHRVLQLARGADGAARPRRGNPRRRGTSRRRGPSRRPWRCRFRPPRGPSRRRCRRSPSRATTKHSPPGAGTRASASPSRRTNAPRAASPWRTSVAPFTNETGRAAASRSSRASGDSTRRNGCGITLTPDPSPEGEGRMPLPPPLSGRAGERITGPT